MILKDSNHTPTTPVEFNPNTTTTSREHQLKLHCKLRLEVSVKIKSFGGDYSNTCLIQTDYPDCLFIYPLCFTVLRFLFLSLFVCPRCCSAKSCVLRESFRVLQFFPGLNTVITHNEHCLWQITTPSFKIHLDYLD